MVDTHFVPVVSLGGEPLDERYSTIGGNSGPTISTILGQRSISSREYLGYVSRAIQPEGIGLYESIATVVALMVS